MTAPGVGGWVWLDGELCPRARARVSIDDLGFRYGAGCMETMRWEAGAIFRLDRHLARLGRGLASLGVRPPPEALLARAVRETVAANLGAGVDAPEPGGAARVRLVVTPGRGGAGPQLATAGPPTVLVVADPLPAALPAAAAVRLAESVERVPRRRAAGGAKHLNYLPMLLALAEARARGADEALLLADDGRAVEGATSNLFVVHDGVLRTPPLADGPLAGVTREAVLEVAAAGGVATEERSLSPEDIARADECFLTSAVAGVRPVGAFLPAASPEVAFAVPGPVTAALTAGLAALRAGEGAAARSARPGTAAEHAAAAAAEHAAGADGPDRAP